MVSGRRRRSPILGGGRRSPVKLVCDERPSREEMRKISPKLRKWFGRPTCTFTLVGKFGALRFQNRYHKGEFAIVHPSPKFKGKSKAGRYGDFVYQVDWVVGRSHLTPAFLEELPN